MRSVALLVVLGLLLVALQGIPVSHAAPIFFEEDFRLCGDGSPPAGWTHSPVGIGFSGCDNSEAFPETPPAGPFNGTESLQQRLTGSLIDTWLSPTFSISGASTFSLGFAVRFEAFPASAFGGAFQFAFRDGSAAAGGFGTNSGGTVFTLNSASLWQNQFFQLVLNTWYVVRFDINRPGGSYATFINGTVVDVTQTMAPGGGPHDIDELTVSSRSSGKSWVDWIFTDSVTLDAIPDQSGTVGVPVSIDADTDASTDVIFGLSSAPAFLGISNQTGVIFGTPTAAGSFVVNVTAEVSTGQTFLEFNLTVEEAENFILAWIREFGPAWTLFLIIVGTIGFLVLTLWRGAHGTLDRRRRKK